MLSFKTMWFWQFVGGLLIALMILIGIIITGVKRNTDYLLYRDATTTARKWARYLTESVADLGQIASGEQPSAASMAFFRTAQKSGAVFRYEIFNVNGYSMLVSDRDGVAIVDLSEYSAAAARSSAIGGPVVDAKEGRTPDLPSFFAEAYVPVLVGGRPVAVVAAYVDLTGQRDDFHKAFLTGAAKLCALTVLAFGIPAIAWYRRTREKQQADRRIRFLAHHDELTGLVNRAQLIEQLDREIAALPVRGTSLAVHFLDLDRFKQVNDAFGHDGGDFLLKAVAERLRATTRTLDVVARLGGDEFIVVQTDVGNADQVRDFACRLSAAFIAPVRFKEQDISITVSIGVALAPADGNSSERLLKSADLALYKSKADGRNCIRFFLLEMDSELEARIALERVIRDAVVHDRFELHYQPIFEMLDRRLIGFEALIRLPAKDGTLVAPLVFTPIAEDLRLIDKIGAWVLREACRTAATWPEHLTVAVNLSPAQFLTGSVTGVVAAALKETGLAAHRLELEITETLLLDNTQAILAELRALKAMGVAIVMDDFGTGYSSLSYLWRFPFDKIKIDRSFMQGYDGFGRDAETVVKTIIALGRELHIRVTVEGVETCKQAAFLDKANGDQVQGFFFGRPIPACEVAASIEAHFQQTLPTPSSRPHKGPKCTLSSHRLNDSAVEAGGA
jgi:diguanylate cyclase (GGDEF)-like protein